MSNHSQIASIICDIGTSVISAQTLTGGFSHQSWLVTCADGRQVVVRFGGTSAPVESAVLKLAQTVVPVPDVLATGEGFSVLGYIKGQTLEDLFRAYGDQENLNSLATQLGQIIAAIGTLRFERPGFFENDQLSPAAEAPWSKQLTAFCAAQLWASVRFSADETQVWVNLCKQNAQVLEPVDSISRLVHSDMNPKNIIVDRVDGTWQIAAIIDWEFAYSGCPFADMGNLCRFPSHYPAGFLKACVDSFAKAAPQLTDQWQRQARILDMFALSALAAKPVGHKIGDLAAATIRKWSADGITPLAP